jgi:ABC-type transporter Mla subunit MlaD
MERLLSSMTETSQSWNRTALNADGGIHEIRDAVADLDRVINHTGKDASTITAELKTAAAQVKQAMEAAVHLLENTDHQVDALQRQTVVTLQRVEQAGQNLTRLLERLSHQPSQLIFSAPAEEKPKSP